MQTAIQATTTKDGLPLSITADTSTKLNTPVSSPARLDTRLPLVWNFAPSLSVAKGGKKSYLPSPPLAGSEKSVSSSALPEMSPGDSMPTKSTIVARKSAPSLVSKTNHYSGLGSSDGTIKSPLSTINAVQKEKTPASPLPSPSLANGTKSSKRQGQVALNGKGLPSHMRKISSSDQSLPRNSNSPSLVKGARKSNGHGGINGYTVKPSEAKNRTSKPKSTQQGVLNGKSKPGDFGVVPAPPILAQDRTPSRDTVVQMNENFTSREVQAKTPSEKRTSNSVVPTGQPVSASQEIDSVPSVPDVLSKEPHELVANGTKNSAHSSEALAPLELSRNAAETAPKAPEIDIPMDLDHDNEDHYTQELIGRPYYSSSGPQILKAGNLEELEKVPALVQTGLDSNFFHKLVRRDDEAHILQELNWTLSYLAHSKRIPHNQLGIGTLRFLFDEYFGALNTDSVDARKQLDFLTSHLGARLDNGNIVKFHTWKQKGYQNFHGEPVLLEYPDLYSVVPHMKLPCKNPTKIATGHGGGSVNGDSGARLEPTSPVPREIAPVAVMSSEPRFSQREKDISIVPDSKPDKVTAFLGPLRPRAVPSNPEAQLQTESGEHMSHCQPLDPSSKAAKIPASIEVSDDDAMEDAAASEPENLTDAPSTTANVSVVPAAISSSVDDLSEDFGAWLSRYLIEQARGSVERHGLKKWTKSELERKNYLGLVTVECIQALTDEQLKRFRKGTDIARVCKSFVREYWDTICAEDPAVDAPLDVAEGLRTEDLPSETPLEHATNTQETRSRSGLGKRKRGMFAPSYVQLMREDMAPMRKRWRQNAESGVITGSLPEPSPKAPIDDSTDPLRAKIDQLVSSEADLARQLQEVEAQRHRSTVAFDKRRQELLLSIEQVPDVPLESMEAWEEYRLLCVRQAASDGAFRRQANELEEAAMLQAEEKDILVARWRRRIETQTQVRSLTGSDGTARDSQGSSANIPEPIPKDNSVGGQMLRFLASLNWGSSSSAQTSVEPALELQQQLARPPLKRKKRSRKNW